MREERQEAGANPAQPRYGEKDNVHAIPLVSTAGKGCTAEEFESGYCTFRERRTREGGEARKIVPAALLPPERDGVHTGPGRGPFFRGPGKGERYMACRIRRYAGRIFLLGVLVLLVPLGASGDPGAVFVTVGADYSSGAVGTANLAEEKGITAPVISGLRGDLSLFANDLGLFVAEHGSEGTLDTISLYDGISWEAPRWNVHKGSIVYGMEYLQGSLYLANYGTNRITRHTPGENLVETGFLSLDRDNGEGFEEHVCALKAYGNKLYALVLSYNLDIWPPEHKEGVLVVLDPQTMENIGEVRVGKNPVALDVWNGKLYVASFGGPIGSPGEEPRLYRIDPVTLEKELLDDGSALGEEYGYSFMGIGNEGTLFVLAYKNGLTWPEQENRVLAGSLEGVTPLGGSSPLSFRKLGNFTSSWNRGLSAQEVGLTPLEIASAWLNAGAVDRENGLFWVSNRGTGAGDAALEVFSSATKTHSFGERELKSLPYGVVPFSFTPPPAPSGGGGGCALGNAFSGTLLLVPLLGSFLGRRKK